MNVIVGVIVISALLVCVYGAPQISNPENDAPLDGEPTEHIPITQQENFRNPDGSYRYSYKTADGTKVIQEGYLKNAGTDKQTLVIQVEYEYIGPDGQVYTVEYIIDKHPEVKVVKGEYSYVAADGQLARVQYIADENGYQPISDRLPTSPPIHPETQLPE